MRKDYAEALYRVMVEEAGIDFVAQLPDDQIHDLQKLFYEDPRTICVPVTNESEAVAVGAGGWLGGKTPALLIADSGLLVSSWGLASLAVSYGIPMLVVIAHRGQIGDRNNWRFITYKFTTEPLLETLHIPFTSAGTIEDAKKAIVAAGTSARQWSHPIGVLLHGEVIED